MSRTKLNFIIDTFAFILMMLMMSTAAILEFVLPHGTGGGGRHRQVETFLGLVRHDWGEIHFWIGLCLIAAVAVHLALHWRWIAATAFGKKSRPKSKAVPAG
jgi:hypothetical protein